MRIGVLALQGDFREHLAVLERLGVGGIEVRTPAELATVDGLVVPGGESTTIGRLATTWGLAAPLRERITAGMPTLGTCAGLIYLAAGTTGPDQPQLGVLDVVVARNAFGRQVDSFETELEVAGFDRPFHAVFIRAPLIEKVGADVEVLATVERPEGRRPVFVRQGHVFGASFHPELTDDDRIHRLLVDAVEGS